MGILTVLGSHQAGGCLSRPAVCSLLCVPSIGPHCINPNAEVVLDCILSFIFQSQLFSKFWNSISQTPCCSDFLLLTDTTVALAHHGCSQEQFQQAPKLSLVLLIEASKLMQLFQSVLIFSSPLFSGYLVMSKFKLRSMQLGSCQSLALKHLLLFVVIRVVASQLTFKTKLYQISHVIETFELYQGHFALLENPNSSFTPQGQLDFLHRSPLLTD